MPLFHYVSSALHCDSVPLSRLADEFGTPLYVYSGMAIRTNYRRLAQAFAPIGPAIHYAVKANDALAVLRLLRDEGAGFDVASGGELFRVLRAGGDPAEIVFAGVGKTDAELTFALRAGIGWFNVESQAELAALDRLAREHGRSANVALRLNPAVAAETHPHIATGGAADKFGIPIDEALDILRAANAYPALHFRGIHIHIGSQLRSPQASLLALDSALNFLEHARAVGISIDMLDVGGGFPVQYRDDEDLPSIEDFAAPIVSKLQSLIPTLQIHLEPGRFLVANAGALLLTVQARKRSAGRSVLVVDGGMNALIRPALYDAYHRVLPLSRIEASTPCEEMDVAGPICESADVLARARPLPALARGDRLAVLDAGAYGMAMASNYNAQPRPAEVLVEGSAYRLIRRRETYADLVACEE